MFFLYTPHKYFCLLGVPGRQSLQDTVHLEHMKYSQNFLPVGIHRCIFSSSFFTICESGTEIPAVSSL